ncbi:MAG: hypothetical protein ACLQO7_10770 [Candidatus Bathyarchaeia archaeon]
MFTINRFENGRIIRQATDKEHSRYLAELSKKPKDDQLSGEVKGDAYGLTGLIYMQEISHKKTKTKSNSIKSEITYFDVAGKENSDETLELAKERAVERGVKTIIIASIRGETASKALKTFKDTDIKLVMATCNACNGCDRFSKEIWQEVEKAGHKVIYTNEDAVPFPPEAVLAYRRICEGMKVAVQITMSAVDQGYIAPGEKIIAIAGTGGKSYSKGWGVDTAVIIEAQGSTEFFSYPQMMKDLKLYGQKIREIICMPR